jgi:capsid protein
VIREKDDGRAARRDLHGSRNDATGEDLSLARDDPRPAKARAHAVARRFYLEVAREEQRLCLVGETLGMWARDGTYLSGVVIRGMKRSTGTFRVDTGFAERKRVAGPQRSADRSGQIRGAAPEHRLCEDTT